uniref:Uncharacterized protein n=1 Tax=Liagoropsis maxima TaxID=1653392 RepID=A0A1G4NW63_9FLOR|nr:Hypothetical protein ORF_8 [Liagoropsis maxima]SCW22756.1 Hypothetical protein ORF_8 [Liagoropsis maxima]
MGELIMETIHVNDVFDDFNGSLEDEKLIGWSATCLDQTISYYVEYNCNEMNQNESLRNVDEDKNPM